MLDVVNPLTIILFLSIHHFSSTMCLPIVNLPFVVVILRYDPPHAVHAIIHPITIVVYSIIEYKNPLTMTHASRTMTIVYSFLVLKWPLFFEACCTCWYWL